MYRKNLIFASAFLGMLLFGISIITLGSIAPDLTVKLKMDEISAGTLFSILPIGILAGSLLFGPVVDRYGYKFLLCVSTLLLSGGFEGIALAKTDGIIKLYAFIIGAGGGAVNGATNALVADISDSHKGANLSLLGVFFGIGALGMPLVLGLLRNTFSYETIIASVGVIMLAAAVLFLLLRFPNPKQSQGFPFKDGLKLVRDKLLMLFALFLFFQSSFEGVINNWTTTFLTDKLGVGQNLALYGLSAYVAGMAVMRLIAGTALRKIPERKLLYYSFVLILSGLILIKTANDYFQSVAGLFVLGTGLASGFPVMLGFTGERYISLSGTAFSIVLSVALIGNMSVNYAMGLIAKNFGISNLINIAFLELILLIVLASVIIRKMNTKKFQN
jgi:MFS family permease